MQNVLSYVLKYRNLEGLAFQYPNYIGYFFIHVINLFVHSYNIQHNRDQLQDHYIINCKALDIKNNNQIWGMFIKKFK